VDDDDGIIDNIGNLFGSPSSNNAQDDQDDDNDSDGPSFWYILGILALSFVALAVVIAVIGGVAFLGFRWYKGRKDANTSRDSFDYISMGPEVPTEIN